MNWMTVGEPNYSIPQPFGNPFQQQQQQQGSPQQQQNQQGLAQQIMDWIKRYQQRNQPVDQYLNDQTVAQQPPTSSPPSPSGDNTNAAPQSSIPNTNDYWQIYQMLQQQYPGQVPGGMGGW